MEQAIINDVAMDDVSKLLQSKSRKRKATSKVGKDKRTMFQLSPTKTPLMQLNEMIPGLKFEVESQEGTPHEPIFVVSVIVDNQKFFGKGSSKKQAKHGAAFAALQAIIQASSKYISDCPSTFENGKVLDPPSNEGFKIVEVEKMDAKIDTSYERAKKHPVMLLNELHPGSKFDFVKENPNVPGNRFTMSVTVNGKIYEGSGTNKKQAKIAAAKAALCHLLNINYTFDAPLFTSSEELAEIQIFPQNVADNIARAVYNKFGEIIESNSNHAKWKVLAGIVMTSDPEMNEIQVITVSTGTKCINGEHISLNGATVNDCHAEIISRRCFKSFLYSQLEMLTNVSTKDQSIFMTADQGGFILKPDIKFHLFISTSPCGDARIFSPHEDVGIDKHPNRKARGVLRTKIESGEGTIPVKGENIQTWDGIIQGQQRLLTMSCSDKVASWNVVGLQGSLLSHFIFPIYLESIILGSLYHPSHMMRAMWMRFENIASDLYSPFRLNKPKMCGTISAVGRHLVKSPNFSVNWVVGQQKPEIINAVTGKMDNGEISHISKQSLFHKFLSLCKYLPGVVEELHKPKQYAEAKAGVKDYQLAKERFRKAFLENGLGSWVRKPLELDEFELTL